MKKFIKKNWIWLLTFSLIVISIVYFQKNNKSAELIGSTATAIALLWMIKGYYQNNQTIQQGQIQIELQTKELTKSIEEMKENNKEMKFQSNILARNTLSSEKEIFFKIADLLALEMTNYIFSIPFILSRITRYKNDILELNNNYSLDNPFLLKKIISFIDEYTRYEVEEKETINKYKQTFEKLINLAEGIDKKEAELLLQNETYIHLVDLYHKSKFGQIYEKFLVIK